MRCQRRALVAALLLDDLHQQHLSALDDVLDLVAAAQRHALAAQFVGGVVALAATAAAPAAVTIAVFGRLFAMILIVMMMGRLDDFQTAIARIGMIVIVIVGAQRGLFLRMGDRKSTRLNSSH